MEAERSSIMTTEHDESNAAAERAVAGQSAPSQIFELTHTHD
jgi:hypothetical protein